jgi:hypothetical protein
MERIMAAATQEDGPPTNGRILAATIDDIEDEPGLKLVATQAQAQVQILPIDDVERPTEN